MAAQTRQLFATSGDGKTLAEMPEGKKNTLRVGEVGALAGEIYIQYSDDEEHVDPFACYFSLDGSLISILPHHKKAILIYDLSERPGHDENEDPIPLKTPLITLKVGEEVLAAGFAAAQRDDLMIGVRSENQERIWNVTHVINDARRKRVITS